MPHILSEVYDLWHPSLKEQLDFIKDQGWDKIPEPREQSYFVPSPAPYQPATEKLYGINADLYRNVSQMEQQMFRAAWELDSQVARNQLASQVSAHSRALNNALLQGLG